MKRTQLSIKTSPAGDYRFHVYRSEDQSSLPADLNILKEQTEIMIVTEAGLEKTAELMEEIIDPDMKKVPIGQLIPYKLSFEPLRNVIHFFVIEMEKVSAEPGGILDMDQHIVKVEFNADQTIRSVTETVNDETFDKTGLDLIKFIDSTVFIADELTIGSQFVRGKYFMKVISVVDDTVDVEGVEYNGPAATGLVAPNLALQKVGKTITTATSIPLIRLQPSKAENGLVYYYRLVAEDSLGNLSDPSGLISSYIDQEAAEIRFQVEVTDNSNLWRHIGMFNNLEIVDFGEPGTLMADQFGTAVADKVRPFVISDIIADTSNVVSLNQVSLTIPNPFNDSDPSFRQREMKRLRARCIDAYGKTSEWYEPNQLDDSEIPIEKVVIMRKNVSGLIEVDRQAPVEIGDPSAVQVKTLIRRYGRFYDSFEHQSAPLNIRVSNSSLIVFDDGTSFPTLTAVDGGIVTGEIYNYTFYLIDSYGEVSTPAIINITT